jgi:membrane protein DedA with SNARE-associated domain
MLEKTLNWVVENLTGLGPWNYFIAFAVLILCGFGVPIPEDITLVAGGLVSGLGATDIAIMSLICFAGVLIGDATMYFIGKIFGYRIQRFKPMRRILTPERFESVQEQFSKYGIWVLFVARFMPGLRSPIFMASGMSQRVPFIHFLLMDGFAALISVPVWLLLGYYCAKSIPELIDKVKHGQSVMHIIILAIVVIAIVLVTKNHLAKKRKQKAEAQAKKKEAEAPADGNEEAELPVQDADVANDSAYENKNRID